MITTDIKMASIPIGTFTTKQLFEYRGQAFIGRLGTSDSWALCIIHNEGVAALRGSYWYSFNREGATQFEVLRFIDINISEVEGGKRT